MKKLLLAALLLLTAVPAWATITLPTARVPRTRRVAVVYNDLRFTTYGLGTTSADDWGLLASFGGVFNALERQGCQVDYFKASQFDIGASGTFQWGTLGDTYSLVFVDGSFAEPSYTHTRFCRADSTNAQLFLLYGGRSTALIGADSTQSQVVAKTTSANSKWWVFAGETKSLNRTVYRPYGSTDTLWLPAHISPPVAAGFASGISSVVRSLEPFQNEGTACMVVSSDMSASNDSNLVKVPTAGDSTASSSAGAGNWEPLGPAWRTYFTNGKWVENCVGNWTNAAYYRNMGYLVYALAAKYVDVQPIKVAVEFDDVFDMVTAGDSTVTPRRWSNAGYDSLLTRWWNTYRCKPAISVDPLHGYEYMRGDDPTWESSNAWSHLLDAPWTGDAWNWPRKHRISWVYHSHDSSATRLSSSLVGRYGGYQGAGNGITNAIGGVNVYAEHRMRAFGWNPGGTFHERRYGIYEKLAYSDSLRRIVCPECVIGPYLSFPDNRVLPVNWRVRNGLAAWPSYRSPSADSLCTPDSTFLAIARGLNVPKGGTLYIRGTVHDGFGGSSGSVFTWRPWEDASLPNKTTNYENKISGVWGKTSTMTDSIPAWTPFTYPGEELIVRDRNSDTDIKGTDGSGGYWIKVKNIGSVSFDATASDIYTQRSLATRRLAQLVGTWSGVQYPSTQSGGSTDWFGVSYHNDPSGVMGNLYGSASLSASGRPYMKDHPRIIYMHPVNWTGSTGAWPTGAGRNSQTDNFEQNILQPVKALNELAGKTIIQWVQPWEVYRK